jgi:hypothetical protein
VREARLGSLASALQPVAAAATATILFTAGHLRAAGSAMHVPAGALAMSLAAAADT